jgi:hypothetical protein
MVKEASIRMFDLQGNLCFSDIEIQGNLIVEFEKSDGLCSDSSVEIQKPRRFCLYWRSSLMSFCSLFVHQTILKESSGLLTQEG